MNGVQHTDPPLVSVAICTYNGAAYLREQLESVIHQTYTRLQIIICDDGSTDETIPVLKEYRVLDPRIEVFLNTANLGFNKNFEKAVGLCSGEYIAISDQDDIWRLDKIEVMMHRWPEDCAFIYSLSRQFSGPVPLYGEEMKKIRLFEGNVPEKLFFDSPVNGHACMFKPALLKYALPFPETIFYDWWLAVAAAATGKVGCIRVTLTYHRMHDKNASRDLVDIADRRKRTAALQQQRIHFIECFLKKDFVSSETRLFSENYLRLLRNKKKEGFSLPLFLFFLRHRSITFYYKKNTNIFSLLKNSFKKSITGL